MEKKIGEHFLFDFYGELLTKNQKQILDYYYNDDYSLAEIAELMSVTRQGIFDVIKRSKKTMETYEKKLGMIERFLLDQAFLENLQNDLERVEKEDKDKNLESQLTKIIHKLKKARDEN